MAPRARFDTDYYAALGLASAATEEEVRKAYRRLALQWHPDRNAGEARAAYERALALAAVPAERRLLRERLAEIERTAGM